MLSYVLVMVMGRVRRTLFPSGVTGGIISASFACASYLFRCKERKIKTRATATTAADTIPNFVLVIVCTVSVSSDRTAWQEKALVCGSVIYGMVHR